MRDINAKEYCGKKSDDFEFVVTRGKIHDPNDDLKKLDSMKKLAKAGKATELSNLAKTYDASGNYSGIFHGNSFKTSCPLFLLGCGFFGPFDKEVGNYVVFLDVIREVGTLKTEKLASIKLSVKDVKKRETFWINFEKPIFIMPKTWHKILFQLDGPATAKCSKKSIITELQGFYNGEKIKFDFQLDSQQMPQLKFKLNC